MFLVFDRADRETVSAFEYLKNMVTHYTNRNIMIKMHDLEMAKFSRDTYII